MFYALKSKVLLNSCLMLPMAYKDLWTGAATREWEAWDAKLRKGKVFWRLFVKE
jgi:hypothetical protein